MGSKKKDRAKVRKAGKAAAAALKEAVAKAQACTPAAATALLQQTQVQEQGQEQQGSPLTMTVPAAPSSPAASGPSTRRLRFEYHTPATLPKAWREPLFQIFKANMQAEYERNWGYKEAEKRAEIFAPEARYLVALAADTEAEATDAEDEGKGPEATEAEAAAVGGQQQQQEPQQGEQGEKGGKCPVLGFVHLRYVLDEEDEAPGDAAVLYIYEIQLAPALQRRGVGAQLMALSERLGAGLGLRKMKLTVFRTNAAALAFYREKLGYTVDASSPSKWGVDECYEILSKPLTVLGSSEAAAPSKA